MNSGMYFFDLTTKHTFTRPSPITIAFIIITWIVTLLPIKFFDLSFWFVLILWPIELVVVSALFNFSFAYILGLISFNIRQSEMCVYPKEKDVLWYDLNRPVLSNIGLNLFEGGKDFTKIEQILYYFFEKRANIYDYRDIDGYLASSFSFYAKDEQIIKEALIKINFIAKNFYAEYEKRHIKKMGVKDNLTKEDIELIKNINDIPLLEKFFKDKKHLSSWMNKNGLFVKKQLLAENDDLSIDHADWLKRSLESFLLEHNNYLFYQKLLLEKQMDKNSQEEIELTILLKNSQNKAQKEFDLINKKLKEKNL